MSDGLWFENLLRQFIDIVYFKHISVVDYQPQWSPQPAMMAVLHCNNPYLSLPFKKDF